MWCLYRCMWASWPIFSGAWMCSSRSGRGWPSASQIILFQPSVWSVLHPDKLTAKAKQNSLDAWFTPRLAVERQIIPKTCPGSNLLSKWSCCSFVCWFSCLAGWWWWCYLGFLPSFLSFLLTWTLFAYIGSGERKLIWKKWEDRSMRTGLRVGFLRGWPESAHLLEAIRLCNERRDCHCVFCFWSLKKEELGTWRKLGEAGQRPSVLLFSYYTLSWDFKSIPVALSAICMLTTPKSLSLGQTPPPGSTWYSSFPLDVPICLTHKQLKRN